nr:uncharacterized protein LOC113825014 [Penaeus vannamei]
MVKQSGRDNKIKMHPPVVNSNGQCELRPPAFVSNDDEDEDPNEFPGVVDLNTVYANMSNSEFGPGTINSDEEYDGDSDEDNLKIADVKVAQTSLQVSRPITSTVIHGIQSSVI